MLNQIEGIGHLGFWRHRRRSDFALNRLCDGRAVIVYELILKRGLMSHRTEFVLLFCLKYCNNLQGPHGGQWSCTNAHHSPHCKIYCKSHIDSETITTNTKASLVSRPLQLAIPYTIEPCSGANVKIGVPENYDGIFPWYLAKVSSFFVTLKHACYILDGCWVFLSLRIINRSLTINRVIQWTDLYSMIQPDWSVLDIDWVLLPTTHYDIVKMNS